MPLTDQELKELQVLFQMDHSIRLELSAKVLLKRRDTVLLNKRMMHGLMIVILLEMSQLPRTQVELELSKQLMEVLIQVLELNVKALLKRKSIALPKENLKMLSMRTALMLG